MRTWTQRRWVAAIVATLGIGLVLGLPTDLVPNPIFGRQIEAPAWAYPAWITTSVLAGLLAATYVRDMAPDATSPNDARRELSADDKRFATGGLLGLFAIGCPTCNALVVIALGSNGALAWFEPVQPLLAVAGISLLAWALKRRLASSRACDIPRKTMA